MSWLGVALLGGAVGLDTTSFPQAMISRPLVAGAVTGALFGRPVEGILLGFVLEAFALIVLPIGAVRYPESGTATVAATAGYMLATPGGFETGAIVLALAFGLLWERVTGESVVLLRRSNGRLLTGGGPVGPSELERRHLTAMSADFGRGAVLTLAGAVIAAFAVSSLSGLWGLSAGTTLGLLTVLAAGMLGTAVALFGGLGVRRSALAAGLLTGLLAGVWL